MSGASHNPNNLIWIDMEMTGLQPDTDRIIEIAMLVTDSELRLVAESPVWVLHQPDEVLEAMDSWNRGTHAKTGLINKVKASTLTEAQAEKQALEFLSQHVPANVSPMCGNSICQDRRFLARWMPQLEGYFHYRNLDVSTLKELVRRWKPEVAKGFAKEGKHEALADILESIEELKFYRRTVMTI
jgi:oligoribonuclease